MRTYDDDEGHLDGADLGLGDDAASSIVSLARLHPC
jgi:hypothetical protein